MMKQNPRLIKDNRHVGKTKEGDVDQIILTFVVGLSLGYESST